MKNLPAPSARSSNIIACGALAEIMTPMLGPCGRRNMVLEEAGSMTLTNDGATLLSHLRVEHPVARSLVSLSRSMDSAAGDGTTSVVVLAAALLQRAEGLLLRGLHARGISEGFMEAASIATSKLLSIARRMDSHEQSQGSSTEAARLAACTALASKMSQQDVALVSALVVQALEGIGWACEVPQLSDRVHVLSIAGAGSRDSFVVGGLVLPKCEPIIGNPAGEWRIAAIEIDLPDERSAKRFAGTLKKLKIDAIAIKCPTAMPDLPASARHWIHKVGVSVLGPLSGESFAQVCQLTDARAVSSADVSEQDVGKADGLTDWCPGGESLTMLERKGGKKVTVVLRGAVATSTAQEAARSFHDALRAAAAAVKCGALVPGGGASEMAMAQAVREENPHSSILKAFTQSLEVIPSALATSCGIGIAEAITRLRSHHRDGEHTFGVRVLESRLGDMETISAVSYTHLRAHETPEHLVCRLLLEKKKKIKNNK
eukprot:TRINITY_DN20283_c0_g1_i2.p1 TRINITY_DN20283_c0_g1~~TRINITY_DN20283_c0_g1_i2.p1  ORF type:complete len:488 (-),score=114.06 TRINITY_DN20283_c0_g1_i2:61-1524(-)